MTILCSAVPILDRPLLRPGLRAGRSFRVELVDRVADTVAHIVDRIVDLVADGFTTVLDVFERLVDLLRGVLQQAAALNKAN